MGHERIGFIPKRKQWQSIVAQLQNYYGDDKTVAKIASDTLDALKGLYNSLSDDSSIVASIRFITILCHFCNSIDELQNAGISVGNKLTMYSLLQGVDKYISADSDSMETNKLAKDSLMNAIITYQQFHETNQLSFDGFEESNVWGNIDSGSAFCEMARSFIAEYTNRNLNYYLERVAASEINNYSNLIYFCECLKSQSEAIMIHSTEISKLMQSFAAGWYNKNAIRKIPDDEKISNFLSITFKKIKEEFRREGAEK